MSTENTPLSNSVLGLNFGSGIGLVTGFITGIFMDTPAKGMLLGLVAGAALGSMIGLFNPVGRKPSDNSPE